LWQGIFTARSIWRRKTIHPFNSEYHVMIWVIATNPTASTDQGALRQC
jgi:hypothetical protein